MENFLKRAIEILIFIVMVTIVILIGIHEVREYKKKVSFIEAVDLAIEDLHFGEGEQTIQISSDNMSFDRVVEDSIVTDTTTYRVYLYYRGDTLVELQTFW